MSLFQTVGTVFKRNFVSGVLVVVPLILTYVVLRFLFETVDNILRPLLARLLGFSVPGIGVAATILLIIVAGVLTRNYIGNRLLRLWDSILARVPLIRPVYSGTKQLLEATTTSSTGSFKEVVLVEYPRHGVYTLCFVTQYVELNLEGKLRRFVAVFLPSTPTPLTGWAMLIPLEDVLAVDMTVEAGIKFVVSGGVVAPPMIRNKKGLQWKQETEVGREAG
ncbi:MAG: DUF502 domain-containing protein [Candidatus Zixiibacteriota bacterium]